MPAQLPNYPSKISQAQVSGPWSVFGIGQVGAFSGATYCTVHLSGIEKRLTSGNYVQMKILTMKNVLIKKKVDQLNFKCDTKSLYVGELDIFLVFNWFLVFFLFLVPRDDSSSIKIFCTALSDFFIRLPLVV